MQIECQGYYTPSPAKQIGYRGVPHNSVPQRAMRGEGIGGLARRSDRDSELRPGMGGWKMYENEAVSAAVGVIE